MDQPFILRYASRGQRLQISQVAEDSEELSVGQITREQWEYCNTSEVTVELTSLILSLTRAQRSAAVYDIPHNYMGFT